MAGQKAHWQQPSHPDIQKVVSASQTADENEFLTKSYSNISLSPFAEFAKMSFPPCTITPEVRYSSVQIGKDQHLELNSDLMYINHSCEPSLIFDTSSMRVLAGPNGLKVDEELTFFYPSTEWSMSQPFQCICSKPTCRGFISGAKDMPPAQLAGLWLSTHIRDLLDEKYGEAELKSRMGLSSPSRLANGGGKTSVQNGTTNGQLR